MAGEIVSFTVTGAPVPKGRPRVYRGRAVTPARTVAYEKLVGYSALQARPWNEPTDKPIRMIMHFYVADNRRRDIDNLQKAVLDGASGILFVDDSQIVSIEATKQVDRENPRVEVVLEILV